MKKKFIFHKNFFMSADQSRCLDNFFNYEIQWLEALKTITRKNTTIQNLWTHKTKQIINLGYRNLGNMVTKNCKIFLIHEGESFFHLELNFIFDQRVLKPDTREKIDKLFHELFRELYNSGFVKKEYNHQKITRD